MPAERFWLAIAGWSGFLAVLLGAFGAHWLPGQLATWHELDGEMLAKRLDQFDVGVRYHLAHAIVLLVLAATGRADGGLRWQPLAPSLMLAGIVLFSGSLYVLVLTNTPWWGAVTPVGGVLWLVAWGMVASPIRRTA